MARPELKVTPALRRKVSIAAGGGMSHEEIAIAIGCDRGTLEKHFAVELSEGAYARRMEVLEAMHAAAGKGNVTAQRAYLDRSPQVSPPADVPDAPAAEKAMKLGKKDQARADARTAADGTHWNDLLPRVGATPLQ